MKGKYSFIIFSSVNWTTHWQLHHQLSNSITDSGGRVLFVENTGVRSPKIKDFRRVIERIKSRLSSVHGFKDVNDNLTVYTPLFIPYPYVRLCIFINTWFISRAILQWGKAANFYSPICISFLPTPSVQEIIKEINPTLTIYYCADNMSRSLTDPNKLTKYEDRFFKDVDLVFTTSHKMFDKALQFSDFVHNIPAGIDSNKFPPQEAPNIPIDIAHIAHPIIGYIGAISVSALLIKSSVFFPILTMLLFCLLKICISFKFVDSIVFPKAKYSFNLHE